MLLFSNGTHRENTNLVLTKFKQEEFSDKPKKTLEPRFSCRTNLVKQAEKVEAK